MADIILVDDNKKLRELYKLSLQMANDMRVVTEAENGQQAIDVAKATHADLILLDLSMPTMDGLQALSHLRKDSPHTHVVILTGFKQERLGDVALELGASAYIEKGITPTALAARLSDVLSQPVPAYYAPDEAKQRELAKRVKDLI